MNALILERNWTEMLQEISNLTSIYQQKYITFVYREFVLYRKYMVMNLSYILSLSLAANAPMEVIKQLLTIDKNVSDVLVLLVYSPIDHYRGIKWGKRTGGYFHRRPFGRAPHPADSMAFDATGMVPVQIACKQFLRPDIIRHLLQYDKAKLGHKVMVDSNRKRNLLHYAVTCALCQFHSKDEETGTIRWKSETRPRGDAQQQQQQTEDTKPDPQDSQDQMDEDVASSPPSVMPSLLSETTFEEYVNLVKYLCKYCSILTRIRDVNGHTPFDLVKAIRTKTKEMRHAKTLTEEEKTYYDRVSYIYKILKLTTRRSNNLVVEDDLKSVNAQCGGSTGWTLSELLEDKSYFDIEGSHFVCQQGKRII